MARRVSLKIPLTSPRRALPKASSAKSDIRAILYGENETNQYYNSRTDPDVKLTNYLENGATALREAIATDAETTRKLTDALKIFGEMETKTKELVRAALRSESQ